MQAIQATPARPGSWKDAFLAGLPHLLFGASFGFTSAFRSLAAQQALTLILGIPLAAILCIAAVYAWKEKWPAWSASWLGYWIWAGLNALIQVTNILNRRFHLFVGWEFIYSLSVLAIGLYVLFIVWLSRKSRIKGILAAFFLIPILLPMFMLEFVPAYAEGFLVFASGLMAAVSAALIVQWDDWRAGAGLAVAANVIIGICYASAEAFKDGSPGSIQELLASGALFSYLKVFLLVSLAVILVPLVLWAAWDAGKRQLHT
jgi:hypothetical protein